MTIYSRLLEEGVERPAIKVINRTHDFSPLLNIGTYVCFTMAKLFMMCEYDCGLIVIKYMEIWEGVPRFDGKSMPQY